jgi:hypothetical protein
MRNVLLLALQTEGSASYIAWHLGIESERPTAVLVPA